MIVCDLESYCFTYNSFKGFAIIFAALLGFSAATLFASDQAG